MQTNINKNMNTSAQTQPVVSPQQDPTRIREAQDTLHQLQQLLLDDGSNMELISESLKKAEDFSKDASQQPNMDGDTRKTLQDITVLLESARALGKNKDIDERLGKIYQETQRLLKVTSGENVTDAAKHASLSVLEFIETWRPLFYQLMSSSQFRYLLLELIKITKNVAYSYNDPILDRASEKFVEGTPASEIAENVKSEMEQKGVPELSDEEWKLIQDDIRRVLVILSREPQYHQGVVQIFTLLDMFQKNLIQSPTDILHENLPVDGLVKETEDLVAAFSGRETLENFKFHLKNLIEKVQKDEELQSYLTELKVFLLQTRSEDEIRSSEFVPKARNLTDRGRELFRQFKDDDDLKPFLDSTNHMIDNIKNDEFLQLLRHHAGIVQSDISYVDSQGTVRVDTDMLTKLQRVLLPILVDALKYIPVPKIQSTDASREFWLDNIVLCSYDLLPENIKFHLETDSEISLRDIEVKGTRTHLVIELNRLLTELKDVEFFYRMKTFPSLEERGRATFRIKGKGAKLTFTYTLLQEAAGSQPRLNEGYANFNVSDMEIDFDTSSLQHPVLVPLLTGLFKAHIKQQIEEQVENSLSGFIDKLGKLMTDSLADYNRPLMDGIELAKKTVKSSQMAQVYEKRREILE